MQTVSKYPRVAFCYVSLTVVSGAVINVFEAIDVIQLIKGGVYDDLNMSVGDALLKRPSVG